MAKTQEELKQLKNECEELSKKLSELTEEELKSVTGGDVTPANIVGYNPKDKEHNIMIAD